MIGYPGPIFLLIYNRFFSGDIFKTKSRESLQTCSTAVIGCPDAIFLLISKWVFSGYKFETKTRGSTHILALMLWLGAQTQYFCSFEIEIILVVNAKRNQGREFTFLLYWCDWVSGHNIFAHLQLSYFWWYIFETKSRESVYKLALLLWLGARIQSFWSFDNRNYCGDKCKT